MKTGPAFERTRRLSSRKYDSKGSFAPNSYKIPFSGVMGVVFAVLVFAWLVSALLAAGF